MVIAMTGQSIDICHTGLKGLIWEVRQMGYMGGQPDRLDRPDTTGLYQTNNGYVKIWLEITLGLKVPAHVRLA